MRRELKAALRFAPWLLASVLLTAGLLQTDLAATAGLYQSPSGASQSPLSPTPTTAAPSPTTAPTEAPTAPQMTPTGTDTPPPVTGVPTPTVTTELPPTATWTPSTTPTLEPTATATLPPTVTPVASPTDSNGRYATEDSNVVFELGTLFDSVALGLTYVWLCCGVLVMMGIPLAFIILWLASKRQRATAEEPEAEEQQESLPEE